MEISVANALQRFLARRLKSAVSPSSEATMESSSNGGSTRDSLKVLRANSRYRKLFAARTASVFGSQFTSLALAFGILGLPGHDNAATLGLVFAAASTGTVLFLLVGGVLADRTRRDRLIMGSDLLSGLSVAMTATLFATHHANGLNLALLSFVSGGAGAVRSPALTGLLPSILEDTQLQAGNALLRLSNNIASLVGPAIAAVVVATAGVPAALYIDAASFIVSIAFVSGINLSSPIPSGFSMLTDLRHGWKAFIANQWVWVVVAGFMVYNAASAGVFSVLGPIVMKSHFDGARGWAVVTTTMAIGSIIGAGISIRLRPRRPMLVGIAAVSPLVVFILALAQPLPLILISIFGLAYAVGSDIFGVQWESGLQRHIESHLISRVSSYDWMGSLLATPIGLSVTGLLASHLGVETTIIGAAGLCGASLFAMLATPSVRAMKSHPEGQRSHK
jgi:MFS family permease